jgi:hypothetical protein
MSLSFVASAVQTGTSDGNYEETPIENTETAAVNRQNSHKPLFEQLRANQEEEEAKQEDMQRQMMRGTLALDEEDVAHLDGLERQRQERARAIQMQTQDEVTAFRAARLEQQQLLLEGDDDEEYEGDDRNEGVVSKTSVVAAPAPAPLKPKFIVKKRRKRTDLGRPSQDTESQKKQKKEDMKGEDDEEAKEKQQEEKKPVKEETQGLGGLFSGYGSSDEDSD